MSDTENRLSPETVLTAEAINNFFRRNDNFAHHLDVMITEVSPDHAVATMPLKSLHRNGMRNAHGGAIFALADMAFGAAAAMSGNVFVSANSSINYLAAGRIGPLRAEARKVRCGKTLGVYDIRITDADGTLIAICTMMGSNTRMTPAEVDAKCANTDK